MTPVEFPAGVGDYPRTVMAEQIESIERDPYYDTHCVLVLASGRRIAVGCTPSRAGQLIREAAQQAPAACDPRCAETCVRAALCATCGRELAAPGEPRTPESALEHAAETN